MMRVILYTGKGGVGKTTVSAATALMAAERGYRTPGISTDTDPTHRVKVKPCRKLDHATMRMEGI